MTFALHIKEHYSCKIFTHHFLQNLSTINSLYNYYYLYYLIRWISKSQHSNFKHCVFKVLILHAIIFSPRLISFPFKILSLFPLPCPLNTKSYEMFLYQMLLFFVLGKANDALFLNMYKQKNLTDFKLLVECHSKQKWKKFTVSKNWISLKTKMIDFQKKKNKVQRFRLWYTCIWYSYTKFTNTEWDSTDQVLKLCIKSAI